MRPRPIPSAVSRTAGAGAVAAALLAGLDLREAAFGWPLAVVPALLAAAAFVIAWRSLAAPRLVTLLAAAALPVLVGLGALPDLAAVHAWWLALAAAWAAGSAAVAWRRWPGFAVLSGVVVITSLVAAGAISLGVPLPTTSVTGVRSAIWVAWIAWLGAALIRDPTWGSANSPRPAYA